MLKLQRLSERSTPKWVEAARTLRSYDIVSSAWKHAAVHKRTGKEVTSFVEDSVIYGAGPKTVKAMLKTDANLVLPFKEVKRLMERWFSLYEGFSVWHDMHKYQYNVYGFVDIETALGRRVRTYSIPDSLNFPIQGSSVEVTKVSIGLLNQRYPDNNLINTIHDSNILLQDEGTEELWGNRLSECMVDAWHYVISDLADPDIPMPHGFESGKIWTFH